MSFLVLLARRRGRDPSFPAARLVRHAASRTPTLKLRQGHERRVRWLGEVNAPRTSLLSREPTGSTHRVDNEEAHVGGGRREGSGGVGACNRQQRPRPAASGWAKRLRFAAHSARTTTGKLIVLSALMHWFPAHSISPRFDASKPVDDDETSTTTPPLRAPPRRRAGIAAPCAVDRHPYRAPRRRLRRPARRRQNRGFLGEASPAPTQISLADPVAAADELISTSLCGPPGTWAGPVTFRARGLGGVRPRRPPAAAARVGVPSPRLDRLAASLDSHAQMAYRRVGCDGSARRASGHVPGGVQGWSALDGNIMLYLHSLFKI